MVENNSEILKIDSARKLLLPSYQTDGFVEKTFHGLYFSDEDNRLIDQIRVNITKLKNPYQRAIGLAALIRTCLKKRPRGIFTYIGYRYDDGRKDLLKSFSDHYLEAVESINNAVFDNGREHKALLGDAMDVDAREAALVYIDPPYYSPLSDNEYVRRYHFVEGLARNWDGVEIQQNTLTKKFKSYPTPFSTKKGASDAFNYLFQQHRNSILLVSYSSNSQPTLEEMVSIMSKYKSRVEVLPINYRYSVGNQGHKVKDNKNKAQEFLFIGY